MKKFEILF